MTIAIIGAGSVGQALAKALTHKGESIFFGVPDPEKYRAIAAGISPNIQVGQAQEAVAAADMIILAVPYEAAGSVVASIPDWQGKILVDATNPLAPGLSGLTVGTTRSGAEEIASQAHNARVVKAFNTTGANNMADSTYPGGQIFMPVCGDDAEARAKVIALAALIGFDAADLGALSSARYLEPFAMTWIHWAAKLGYGRNFAFSVLRRS